VQVAYPLKKWMTISDKNELVSEYRGKL
jgi:hypothetical protein